MTSEKLRKILMVLTLNSELSQDIINLISNLSFLESDKAEKGNLQYLFWLISFLIIEIFLILLMFFLGFC